MVALGFDLFSHWCDFVRGRRSDFLRLELTVLKILLKCVSLGHVGKPFW